MALTPCHMYERNTRRVLGATSFQIDENWEVVIQVIRKNKYTKSINVQTKNLEKTPRPNDLKPPH